MVYHGVNIAPVPPVTLVWEMVVKGVGGSQGIEDKIGD